MRITKFARTLCVAVTVTATLVASASYGQVPQAQAQALAAENFTLVMLPDTQYASEYWPEVFRAQMQWVDNQQAAQNIRYVLHVGDVVDNSDQLFQWNNSKSAMGLPTDDVPYIIGPGNHDLDSTTTRAATRYNTHYPRATFTGLPSFGGTYPASANDNAYHTFTAGGVDWLVVAMKYAPSDAEIAWANQVVTAHPYHNAILVTHAYQNGTTKDTNGNKLWTNLVSKHANFRFTFSGHYVNAGVITQQGVNGNTVHQIQADYQNSSQRDPNSYLRVMTYNPTTDALDIKTYSPYLNRYMTDAKNQFVLSNINPVRPAWSTIVDNATAGRFTASANWGTSMYSSQRYGADYRYAPPNTTASDVAWYKVNIPETGNYQVSVWYADDPGYNDSTPFMIATPTGNQTVRVNQRANGGRWVTLGRFTLAAGDANKVGISRWTSGTGYVIADAVRITRTG
ncbi:metallophosphoesterase [Allorhizocola rhizosphaerae]|uniref:golvesin C-terminal-like domain-containing protein n=1 Tax=Allorhizocola rhizosphaerae TaxID=1872709 RepID=UPI001B8D71B8|nr:metallophosphoesterase [Allorhizocola rhizosphaerae]